MVILDELGDRISPGLAEMLASDGREVEVITRWPALSHMWSFFWVEMPLLYGKLDELGVKVVPSSWIKEIAGTKLSCFNVYSGREWEERADSVILVTMKYSNMEPYKLLKAKGVKGLHLIGDAKSPRQIGDAMRDGLAAALEM